MNSFLLFSCAFCKEFKKAFDVKAHMLHIDYWRVVSFTSTEVPM